MCSPSLLPIRPVPNPDPLPLYPPVFRPVRPTAPLKTRNGKRKTCHAEQEPRKCAKLPSCTRNQRPAAAFIRHFLSAPHASLRAAGTNPAPAARNASLTQKRVLLPHIGQICRTLSHLVALCRPRVDLPFVLSQEKGRKSCHKGRKTGSTFSDFGRLWSTSDTLSIPFLPTPQGRSLCPPFMKTLGLSLCSPRVRAVPGD